MNMMTTYVVAIDAVQTMAVDRGEVFLKDVKAEIVDPLSNLLVTAVEFQTRVKEEMAHLQTYGQGRRVQAGDRVFLEARSDIQFLVRLFALIELKAIVVPFDHKVTAAEYQRLLLSSQPDYRYLSRANVPEDAREAADSVRSGVKLPEDACLILLTSGTTGLPKAVIHGASNLRARFGNGRHAIPQEHRRSCLSVLPLHFGHGLIGVVLQALFDSERLVLIPSDLGDPRLTSQIGPWIDANEVTFISGTPGSWSYITRMSVPPKGGSLRRVQVASAHMTQEMHRRIRDWAKAPFYNCYGMTETATWVSDRLIDDGTDVNNVGTGRNWNSAFEILSPDESGVGEVAVATSSLSYGYLEEWTTNKARNSRHLTGDWGQLNQEGELLLLGRRSRIINRGGLKVSPEEIEREILGLSLVEDVVVSGASDLSGRQTNVDSIVGILVLKEPVGISTHDQAEIEKALLQGLLKTLSPHKIPGQWVFWESIPRRPNGKPDMAAIKTKFREGNPA